MRLQFMMVMVIIICFPLYAGASGLSLQDAIDLAISNHPSIIQARAAVEEMHAASGQLEAGMGWRIDGNVNGTHQKTSDIMKLPYEISGGEAPDSYSMYTASLIVSKGVFWAPENKVRRGQAQIGIESAEEQFRMARDRIFVDVVAAYYNIWKAADGVELARAVRDDADLRLKVAQEKLANGSGTERDVASARTGLLQAESSLQLAQEGLNLGLRVFANLIGMRSLGLEEIACPEIDINGFPLKPSPWSWGIDDMIKLALKYRPEMRLSELGLSISWGDVNIARAQGFPDINLSASYTWGERGMRLDSSLDSKGRWSGILSKADDFMPPVEEVELTDEDWQRWNDLWGEFWEGEPPDWSPTREQMENILSSGATAGAADTWDIKLGITFNLFDSHLVKREVERAEKKVEQAKSQAELTAQMIEMDVLQRYNELLETYNGVKIAQLQMIEAEQQRMEAQGIKARGLLTQQEEEGLKILLLQKERQLKWALYDYEVAKAKLGVAIGIEEEWLTGALNL